MPPAPESLHPVVVFKWGVYTLLTLNIFLLLRYASVHEAIDSVGWVILIAVMEYETTTLGQAYSGAWEKRLVIAARVFAYVLIVHAWYVYLTEREWLDFANATVWLLVCASLEYDVHAPGAYGGGEWRVRTVIKSVLYGLLACFVVGWGVQAMLGHGEDSLLNFYDAALWLLCFFVIELNVFQFEAARRRPSPAGA